jgi:hypothetical protein
VITRREFIFPLERSCIEYVHAWIAFDILAYSANDDNLTVVHGAGVAGTWGWSVIVGLVDFDPCEGRNGKDVHVIILRLVSL